MMDGIQENITILGSPETQTEKLQSSLPAGFPKIFGRKQSTSKTVPRGALAIGLLRSSCLVGVCVCARLYLQFKLQNLWVLGCSPKISGAGPVLCRFRPLISNFPATGQCHKLFAVTLESKRRGRTLCHWQKTFKFCPVKLLQSHVSTSYMWCLHGRFRDFTLWPPLSSGIWLAGALQSEGSNKDRIALELLFIMHFWNPSSIGSPAIMRLSFKIRATIKPMVGPHALPSPSLAPWDFRKQA
jgi:hypothetical protein